MNRAPRIGLMLGDVTGIGPEVATGLFAAPHTHEHGHVVVVADARALQRGMRDAGVQFPIVKIRHPADFNPWASGVQLIDLGNIDPTLFERGRLTGETLKVMTDWAQEGALDAVCFAPLDKAALQGIAGVGAMQRASEIAVQIASDRLRRPHPAAVPTAH